MGRYAQCKPFSQLYSARDYMNHNVVPCDLPNAHAVKKDSTKSANFFFMAKMDIFEKSYVFSARLDDNFRKHFKIAALKTFLDRNANVDDIDLTACSMWTIVQFGIQEDMYIVTCYVRTIHNTWKSAGFSTITLKSFDVEEWFAAQCLASRFHT